MFQFYRTLLQIFHSEVKTQKRCIDQFFNISRLLFNLLKLAKYLYESDPLIIVKSLIKKYNGTFCWKKTAVLSKKSKKNSWKWNGKFHKEKYFESHHRRTQSDHSRHFHSMYVKQDLNKSPDQRHSKFIRLEGVGKPGSQSSIL